MSSSIANIEIEVIGDLPKVEAVVAQKLKEKEEEEQKLLLLEQQREQMDHTLQENREALKKKEEELISTETSINEALKNVVSVTKNEKTLAGKDGWFQLNVAKSALDILTHLANVKKDNEIIKQGQFDGVVVTSLVGNAVAALSVYMHCSAPVLKVFKDHKQRVEAIVINELGEELRLMGWADESFHKPADFQYLTSCLEWMIALKISDKISGLLFDPFKKKFTFHFLGSAEALAKPELYYEVVKKVIDWLQTRFEFVTKLQSLIELDTINLMMEFVKTLSELLIIRTKRDLTAVTNESKKFLDIVDEVFVWSSLVDKYFGYAMTNGKLSHVLLSCLMPTKQAVVFDHWLTLEKRIAEQVLKEKKDDLEGVFVEVQMRTLHRLSKMPFVWQRQMYTERVLSVLIVGKKRQLMQALDDAMIIQTKKERKIWLGAIEQLNVFATTMKHWCILPDYSEDQDLLLNTSTESAERVRQDIARFVQMVKLEFVESLDPWFEKNWLYVSKQTAEHLTADKDSRFDLSTEVCEPYEKLRENVRIAMKCLSENLFAELALMLTNELDESLLEMLFDFSPSISVELARQMEFDSSLIFGVFSSLTTNAAVLFKRFSEALSILLFDENTLLALKFINQIDEEERKIILAKYGLKNLDTDSVLKVCSLRKDLNE